MGEGVADGGSSSVGLVQSTLDQIAKKVSYGGVDLLFASASVANNGLFDAQGGIFKNGQSTSSGGQEGGGPGSTEGGCGADVLDVNGPFAGHVLYRVAGENFFDPFLNAGEAMVKALPRVNFERIASADTKNPAVVFNDCEASTPETWVEAEDGAVESPPCRLDDLRGIRLGARRATLAYIVAPLGAARLFGHEASLHQLRRA